MRASSICIAFAFFAGIASTVSAGPIYAPTGPQTNVAKATVEAGGWTLCFSNPMQNVSADPISTILAGCDGDLLMMAGGITGSATLSLLAWAPEVDVTFNTGTSNTAHDANGTSWYFNDSWSWGFAPLGAELQRNSCDYGDDPTDTASVTPDPFRLCWHTGGGFISSGWRVGTVSGNAFGEELNRYSRYLYTASSADLVPVPEPTSLLLFGSGVAGIVTKVRRRRSQQIH